MFLKTKLRNLVGVVAKGMDSINHLSESQSGSQMSKVRNIHYRTPRILKSYKRLLTLLACKSLKPVHYRHSYTHSGGSGVGVH